MAKMSSRPPAPSLRCYEHPGSGLIEVAYITCTQLVCIECGNVVKILDANLEIPEENVDDGCP